MKNFLFLILAFLLVGNVFANNIVVDNVVLQKSPNQGSAFVQFNISWENSWREDVQASNWDAAWVFLKFRLEGGQWQHAKLSNLSGDHIAPAGSVIDVPADGLGVFIYRKWNGTGSVNFTGAKLMWDYQSNGILPGDSVEVKVFAVEMVYVPRGNFWLGDGSSYASLRQTGSNSPALVSDLLTNVKMDGSDPLTGDGILQSGIIVTGDTGIVDGNGNKFFPVGYNGFYCMKYEISQKQYADFLNLLNPVQAATRYPNSNGLNRNTIAGSYPDFSASAPHLACNWLSWADGAAYYDWTGLRQLTEMEFENASPGNNATDSGEFDWGK